MWENIKLVTAERRREEEETIYLVSEPNYHALKFFTENLLARNIKKKKTQILMNKPVYLGLSILELNKMLMYKLWYDCVKPNIMKKQNCFMFYCIHKNMILMKTLQKMLKLDLILQIMN